MNLGKIKLVAGYEFTSRVKKKSFILITLLTPLLVGLLICVPILIQQIGSNEVHIVKVFDESGFIRPALENSDNTCYVDPAEGETPDSVSKNLEDEGLYAVLQVIQGDDGEIRLESRSAEPLNLQLKSEIKRCADRAIESRRLAGYNMGDLNRILEEVKSDVPFNTLSVTKDGDTKKDSVGIYMIISYLMGFFIYMFILMFGALVMGSVRQEKSSRVVEVIVSSVNATDLMIGKIIGMAMVAITQFLVWAALTVAVVSLAGGALMGSGESAMQTMQTGEAISDGSGVHPPVGEIASEIAAPSEISGYISQLLSLNWGLILLSFALFFIFGYLLYASMFAALGTIGDSDTETSQMQLVVTLPLMIGLFMMLHTFEHPNSAVSVWGSLIPFTSPMVMLARIPFGTVPLWQLILSLALLLFTFIAIAAVSAKIYRNGVLSYGKKTGFKDIVAWIKQKK